MKTVHRYFIFLGFAYFLSGCAGLPPIITYLGYAKTAVDVGMYAATEKTTTDHALSAMTEKDCALFRVLEDKKVCVERNKDSEETTVQKNEEQPKVDFIIPDEIAYKSTTRSNIIVDYSVLDVLEMKKRMNNNRL